MSYRTTEPTFLTGDCGDVGDEHWQLLVIVNPPKIVLFDLPMSPPTSDTLKDLLFQSNGPNKKKSIVFCYVIGIA